MKTEKCSCYVRLINYVLYNKVVSDCKFIHFFNYCKHSGMLHLKKKFHLHSWCKQEEKLGRDYLGI
jgi:hypothetical protein